MSLFSELEVSIFGSRPIDLYKFTHGTEIWAYSAVDKTVEYESEQYNRLSISRSSIGHQSEIAKADITVSCPIDCEVSQLYLIGFPENVVTLTIFRLHDGATDGGIVYWKGRVVSVKWNEVTCELTCESIYSRQKRTGLRARYTRGCRHVIYGQGCNVEKSTFGITATVTAIDSSLTVLTVPTVSGYANGYFLSGMIGTADGVYRFIVGHSGSTLTLTSPIGSIAVDDEITVYPGCNHTLSACRDKFSNIANYGGFPWIPTDNPFDGSVV